MHIKGTTIINKRLEKVTTVTVLSIVKGSKEIKRTDNWKKIINYPRV